MAEKEFHVRSEIMAMIAKTTDDNMRMVWVIMLGLLEQSAAGLSEISDKIDKLLADEESLRKSVLNGHEPTHHSDHDWTQARRKEKCEEACAWARKKMEAEAEDEKTAADLVKAGKKAAIEQGARMAVIGLVGVMTGVAGVLWALK